MNYWQYIASSAWRRKRKQRIALDGNRCRLCDRSGDEWQLDVHHRPSSYERIPDESVEEDLITLCDRCHNLAEDAIQQDRYAQQQPESIEPMQSVVEPRKDMYHVASTHLSPDIRQPDDPAFWANRQSHKQMGKGDEIDLREKSQDRLGS